MGSGAKSGVSFSWGRVVQLSQSPSVRSSSLFLTDGLAGYIEQQRSNICERREGRGQTVDSGKLAGTLYCQLALTPKGTIQRGKGTTQRESAFPSQRSCHSCSTISLPKAISSSPLPSGAERVYTFAFGGDV